MGEGRIVKKTAGSPGGGDPQPVVYVVAADDRPKPGQLGSREREVEVLGRASRIELSNGDDEAAREQDDNLDAGLG